MKFLRTMPIALSALMVAMSSCGDKEKIDDEKDLEGEGTGTMELMTPIESKTFLENSTVEFLQKFRPADQKEVINLASWFVHEYGELDMPANFEYTDEEVEKSEYSPATYMRALLKGLRAASADYIGTATTTYTYNINFDRFSGIYKPGISRWVKAGESNDIIFQFKDETGKDCELKATKADGTSDYTYEYTDEGYNYHDQVNYVDNYKYIISIPKTINVTLHQDGKELVNGQVKSNIDVQGHTASINVYTKVANLEAVVDFTANDTKAEQKSQLKVNGDVVASSRADITGNNLCNIDAIRKSVENGDSDNDVLLSYIQAGSAKVDMLSKVQLYGNVTFNREVLNAIDGDFDYGDSYYYEYHSKVEAEAAAKKACDNLNQYVKAYARYNNTTTDQATIIFKTKEYRWGDSGDFDIEPLLQFEADKTTYTFEDYFETGFTGVEDLWNSTIKNYEKLWDVYTHD